jgi:hypothetical protein
VDLSRFLPNFGKADAELTEEELDEQDLQAKKRRAELGARGPRKLGWLTNGQIRRMQTRREATRQRKANKAYRRNWLTAEAATATLKAQVLVAMGITPATPDGQRNAHLAIIRTFGIRDDEGNLTNDPLMAAHDHLVDVLGTRNEILKANERPRHDVDIEVGKLPKGGVAEIVERMTVDA